MLRQNVRSFTQHPGCFDRPQEFAYVPRPINVRLGTNRPRILNLGLSRLVKCVSMR
jgi:hypothetical protein